MNGSGEVDWGGWAVLEGEGGGVRPCGGSYRRSYAGSSARFTTTASATHIQPCGHPDTDLLPANGGAEPHPTIPPSRPGSPTPSHFTQTGGRGVECVSFCLRLASGNLACPAQPHRPRRHPPNPPRQTDQATPPTRPRPAGPAEPHSFAAGMIDAHVDGHGENVERPGALTSSAGSMASGSVKAQARLAHSCAGAPVWSVR